MVTIKSAATTNKETQAAFQELKNGLHPNPKLILFFSSTTQDFHELSKLFHESYPKTEVLGVTTTGELGPNGFLSNGVSASSFDGNGFSAKGVYIEDIVKYPVFHRESLIKALKDTGINPHSHNLAKEGIGLVFPNGLVGAEEKMLSVVNSLFEKDGFPLFGGTAGDDAKFQATYVSHNGKVSSTAGLVVFLKTDGDFHIVKENIFLPTGKLMKITKADTENRIVYQMNGKPAATEYARLLGVSPSQLPNYFMTNPLGRTVNDEVFIASPFQVQANGAIQFYCQIFEDSTVEILEPKNPVETLKDTVAAFQDDFHRLDGVLAINCILRKLQFENQRLTPTLNKELEKLPNLSGFVSYGEQLNNTQLNQTLILLGFGTLK